MSQADQPIEWYLARDGQQHGPISAAEMEKIIELGYLLPTDLVWRQGFTDWKPASDAFPKMPEVPTQAPPPPAPPPAQAAPRPADAPAAKAGPAEPRADTARDRAHIAKDPASWEAEARRKTVQGGSDPAGQDAGPKDRPGQAPARHSDPREVIAAEAARREAAARRTREAATQQPGARGPAAGRQPATGQPMGEAPVRTNPTAPLRSPQPAAGGAMPPHGGDEDDAWADEPPRRRLPKLAIAAVALLVLIGGGVFALHATGQLDPIVNRVSSASAPQSSTPPTVSASPEARKQAPADYATDPVEVDRQFQRTALWKLLKTEFPDWYGERVRDTARLKAEGKADKAISQHLAEQLVALRRKHVTDALAASPQHLKTVATAFLENLERLSQHSVDACYGFISQGETNPLIVELTSASEHTPSLQRQASAIFTAIVEGRRTPAQHRQPTRDDYDQLAIQLAKRGWSPMDLQLFSDARSLARAAPERVCRMVQDWFAAQLAVGDEEVQVRLLIEALKPVVAG
ncbi:MAG: DUF4339 domain-containing protein [Hyphomicrobium sp.]|nr:DUF4339 domain-containing protein [Hyphomicrobium sp.]